MKLLQIPEINWTAESVGWADRRGVKLRHLDARGDRAEGGEMYAVELYRRVRRAGHVEGMSERAAARHFGIDRKTISKILKHSVPPGYRREEPPARPKLDPFIGIIDQILEDDRSVLKK